MNTTQLNQILEWFGGHNLYGHNLYGPKPLFSFFCPLYKFIYFSASFSAAHCAIDLARDHAP